MDQCWKNLPADVFGRIFFYLDSATRRDLGMKPRRLLALPNLELHRQKLQYYETSIWLNLTMDEGRRHIHYMWSMNTAFPSWFYQRTTMSRFMMIDGVQIWRATGSHDDMFTGVNPLLQ